MKVEQIYIWILTIVSVGFMILLLNNWDNPTNITNDMFFPLAGVVLFVGLAVLSAKYVGVDSR